MRSHNPEVVGSSPASATITDTVNDTIVSFAVLFFNRPVAPRPLLAVILSDRREPKDPFLFQCGFFDSAIAPLRMTWNYAALRSALSTGTGRTRHEIPLDKQPSLCYNT